MSEQIQEGPGPKPKKRKKVRKIKILASPSLSSGGLNNKIYFDCEQEVNSEDVSLIKSISVENTAITNAQEFELETIPITLPPTDFYMHDDKNGSIYTSFAALKKGTLLLLTITYHDELPPEPTYEVSFEM
jgi:hypothetical protein